MPTHRHASLPSRRGFLAGTVGGGLFAVSAQAQSAQSGVLRPGDLASADGTASVLAHARADTRIAVQGFLAPSLDGRAFVLSDGSPMPCGLCGTVHDAGASLAAQADGPIGDAPEIVVIEGRLAVDCGGRPILVFAPAGLRAA